MNFKKLESGRSMVEMLGVLAIIGVLSVGGIAGYSLSMLKHRANQVADLVSKFALVNYANCQKSIIDGDTENIGYCPRISFENSGVGSLPAGVAKISVSSTAPASDTGGDEVIVNVEFNDKKLCQAVGSISGISCYNFDSRVMTYFVIHPN